VETTGIWNLLYIREFQARTGYNVDQLEGSDGLLTFTGILHNLCYFPATSPYATGYINRTTPEYYNENAVGQPADLGKIMGGGGWNLMGNPFASVWMPGLF
jgi:hypothetical protein